MGNVYHYLLTMADIKSLEQRRQFQSLVMLYKCLYDKGAPYISGFFNFKDVSYNFRGLSTRLDFPPFIWSLCIDPLHFLPANFGIRYMYLQKSENHKTLRRLSDLLKLTLREV